jgi:hypothetical protein
MISKAVFEPQLKLGREGLSSPPHGHFQWLLLHVSFIKSFKSLTSRPDERSPKSQRGNRGGRCLIVGQPYNQKLFIGMKKEEILWQKFF